MPRSLLLSPALLALALLAGCGGGATPDPVPAPQATLVPAQPGQVVAYAVERLRARSASPLPQAAAGASPDALATAAQGDRSQPLAQEDGVAEADLLQADAGSVYSLAGTELRRHRLRDDGSLEHLQTLPLAAGDGDGLFQLTGLHLDEASGRAVTLGQSWRQGQWNCSGEVCLALAQPAMLPLASSVVVHAVTTGPTLVTETRLVLDGQLVGSRRVGSRLVLVTRHVPALALDTATGALREAALAALRAEDLLPQVRVGSAAPVPLVTETECLLQPGNASPAVEFTTVTVLDLSAPGLARRSRCFAGGTEAMAMTPDALVLATTRQVYEDRGAQTVYPPAMRTDLHRFVFGVDGTPAYRASGTVDGHLGWDRERKPYRLSESGGHLRVLTFTGREGWAATPPAQTPPSPATLTILRERDGVLAEVSRLPNARRPEPIGKPDEQVFGVRFVGDRGYVVTYRLVDPLYVLDLADPADPRIAAALEVTGVSSDLVPLEPGWLLGVGREADASGIATGLKLSLFDVRDAAAPRLAAAVTLGGPGSQTALDASRQGLSLRRVGGTTRLALPMLLSEPSGLQHGLQRLEADPVAGTLVAKPWLPRPGDGGWVDLSGDRALQIGDRLVWLSAGELVTAGW